MSSHFRGASAASLAAVLDAVENTSGDLSTVGGDLFAVTAALDATPAVRRVLTDPSAAPEARAGLAASILGGKIDPATLAVVEVAARGRWAGGRDLTDAIEVAGLAAHVAAADKAGELDAVEDQLFEAQRIIDGARDLRSVLLDRTVPVAHKRTLIESIFSGKVAAATLALLNQAAATRTASFDGVLEHFADEVAARRSRTLAEVRTATALDDAQLAKLRDALSKKYGKEVHLNTIIDPSVVGGLKVSIDDDVIDGTISGRLEDARRQLIG